VSGGLMLAENDDDVAFLRAKIELERSRGIEAELIGANELRQLEPCIGDVAIAAEWCPGEGKINPLQRDLRVVSRAKTLGRVSGVAATSWPSSSSTGIGLGLEVTTSRGDIRCRRIVNAAGPWAAEVAAMAGVTIPVRGAPLQMIVTEPTRPTLDRLVAHAARHLTLKQMASGAFMIGGGWTAGLDQHQKLARALRSSVEGNLWVASRVVPALADLHAIRIWAGMNVNIDRCADPGRGAGPAGLLQLRQLQRLYAGTGTGAPHRRDDRRALDQPAGRALFHSPVQLRTDGSTSGLPRGRAGSGRSHFWNRPRPAEPLMRPSSMTTSPRDRVSTG
jgi:hypothetical protein